MPTNTLFTTELPIVAAPMAGGATTPALVTAVTHAGGFGFLAGGYKTGPALAAEIEQVRASTERFGVNLFVPGPCHPDPEDLARYAARLQPEADTYGINLSPEPVSDDDHFDDKLNVLLAHPVPVVSFTFALPKPAQIAALKRAGSRVLATVTTPAEARAAAAARVDALIVQGPTAGGHSATFDPERSIAPVATDTLVREVAAHTTLPIVAAGGVDGPEAVRTLLSAGALAVAVGTLLLRTDEAGTSSTHRAALADPALTETTLTRAFTGRPARALRNGFINRHEAEAINAYPAVHHLTRTLRQAAAKAGDADRLHLWAGTGYRAARAGAAAEVVRWLASQ